MRKHCPFNTHIHTVITFSFPAFTTSPFLLFFIGSSPVPRYSWRFPGKGNALLSSEGWLRRRDPGSCHKPAAVAGQGRGHERRRHWRWWEWKRRWKLEWQILRSTGCNDNRHKAGGSSHQPWRPGWQNCIAHTFKCRLVQCHTLLLLGNFRLNNFFFPPPSAHLESVSVCIWLV